MPPLANASKTPKVWTAVELATEAEKSLNAFVDRRLAEPDTRYADHLVPRRRALARLFLTLRPTASGNSDPAAVRKILLDDDLLSALRYAADPPISEDDLGVLVTRKAERLTKGAIREEDSLAPDILKLIRRVADSSRFPGCAPAGNRAPGSSGAPSRRRRRCKPRKPCKWSAVPTGARWSGNSASV
jgi:hypothetical protein